jgi:hypothetical protein
MGQLVAPARGLACEAVTALGKVSVYERAWSEPIDFVIEPKHYWLELQLLPNTDNGRACFADRWTPTRFEPIGRAFMMPAFQLVHIKSQCRHTMSVACVFPPDAIERWFEGELHWAEAV